MYFRENPDRADIIDLESARPNGRRNRPCSTLAALKRAYGKKVHPSPHAIPPDGNTVTAYVVGPI